MGDNAFFPITEWNEDDRPREKLLLKGRLALSDAELIAILIGSGSPNESAVSLSKRILAEAENNLNELGKFSISDLTRFKGIGPAKAVSIIAAMELGRRRRAGEAIERRKIGSSRTVFDYFQPIIGELSHEEFWILYLNNANKILKSDRLSQGGITGTFVDVRVVFKEALQVGAVSLILAHNHPSGTLKPSEPDIRLTKQFKAAGEILNIKILDHLIVTEKSYFSFADENLL